MKKVILMNIIICLLYVACSKDEVEAVGDQVERSKFVEQTIQGIYNGGAALMVYEEDMHQIAYTTDKKSWRLQNDNQSMYVSCVLSEAAIADKEVVVTIKSKGIEGIVDGEQSAVVLKVENAKSWIWLLDLGMGVLVEMK